MDDYHHHISARGHFTDRDDAIAREVIQASVGDY